MATTAFEPVSSESDPDHFTEILGGPYEPRPSTNVVAPRRNSGTDHRVVFAGATKPKVLSSRRVTNDSEIQDEPAVGRGAVTTHPKGQDLERTTRADQQITLEEHHNDPNGPVYRVSAVLTVYDREVKDGDRPYG